MSEILFKVRTVANPGLDDDALVKELMDRLTSRYSEIRGYQWERPAADTLHILMWGDIEDGPKT